MKGRLNLFQRTMLQWNDLHPYNAVHVVRIPSAIEPERLRAVIARVLEGAGLTGLTLDRTAHVFEYRGGSAALELNVLATDGGPDAVLAAEIERQLNRGFDTTKVFLPFRFFVVPERNSFWLGLAYFHAAADAESIVHLVRTLVETYLGAADTGITPLQLVPERPDQLLRRPAVVWRKLTTVPQMIRMMRRSFRPSYANPQDLTNGYLRFTLNREQLAAGLALAHRAGVTANDLFLALLLKCVAPLAASRKKSRKRPDLSAGCIVNTRRDLGVDRRTFGLFLGSFVVTHSVPDGISLTQLAQEIAGQTQAVKRHKLYLAISLELALVRRVLALYSTERQRKFYQKHYPLWGGITNMNLNPLWDQRNAARPVDYLRAVSTGPVTPLVFSLTTVGDILNVGISYRTTVFAGERAAELRERFINLINNTTAPA